MHEILTVQLGHRANHIATHFWNAQESYFTYSADTPSPVDHDIHFRAGLSPVGGETYTPRTLIYDLKGGFGSLRRSGGLYEDDSPSAVGSREGVWYPSRPLPSSAYMLCTTATDGLPPRRNGTPVLQQNPSIPQHPYQQSLDSGLHPPSIHPSTVRTWADYSRVFYHPRSIIQINDYELASSLQPFENWQSGEDLFQAMDKDEGIMDRDVRRWIEECDFLQGVQVIVGADDAWGGFGKGMVEGMKDEIGNKEVWVWGIEKERGSGTRAKQLLRSTNTARTTNELSSQASMYIPLSIPPTRLPRYLNLDRDSQWHTSALLSMALESMTLPSRLRSDQSKRGLLGDIESTLNVNGNQRIASLQCSLLNHTQSHGRDATSIQGSNDQRVPGSNTRNLLGEDDLQEANAFFDMGLSSGEATSSAITATHDRAKEHTFARAETIRDDATREPEADSEQDGLARKRRRLAGAPIVERYRSSLQYPLLDSFPNIFSQPPDALNSVSIHTALSTTSGIIRRIKALQTVVSRMADLDEREALFNGLGDIAEAYEEGWDGCSDDESDD